MRHASAGVPHGFGWLGSLAVSAGTAQFCFEEVILENTTGKGVIAMIKVTRINKIDEFWVNEDLIEFIEETPDTILSLESGKKVPVAESAEKIVNMIIEKKREIFGRYL